MKKTQTGKVLSKEKTRKYWPGIRKGQVLQYTAGSFIDSELPACVKSAIKSCRQALKIYTNRPGDFHTQNAWLKDAMQHLIAAIGLPVTGK